MSHRDAITALKKYSKLAAQSVSPSSFIEALKQESDRGAIILAATMIDDALSTGLRIKMPNINSDEASRIFSYDGIAGSFSSRLKLAQAMDLIDRPTRKMIELIREMRNVCAHARQETTFSTPEIRDAFVSLMPDQMPDQLKNEIRSWPNQQVRDMFCLLCGALCDTVLEKDAYDNALPRELKHLQLMINYVSGKKLNPAPITPLMAKYLGRDVPPAA